MKRRMKETWKRASRRPLLAKRAALEAEIEEPLKGPSHLRATTVFVNDFTQKKNYQKPTLKLNHSNPTFLIRHKSLFSLFSHNNNSIN